jgi:lipopolysaccharide biosynthesis glycosyltransferase
MVRKNIDMIRIFIGYDPRESMAYHVLSHSILYRASSQVSIIPLALNTLVNIFDRPRDPMQSTDFSFTRFLVPYLSQYEGWSLYLDCDMIMVDDMVKLWDLRDEKYSVQVVKNNHLPNMTTKFLNEKQTTYAKKNWSSLMLFNNEKCKSLDLEYIHTASGLDLHQFKWLDSDEEIGALPDRWNYLADCGYEKTIDNISLMHYTNGGPYFKGYENCEYADIWFNEKAKLK